MEGNELKAALMTQNQQVKSSIKGLQTLLETGTPMAKQFRVWGDIEKLMRAAEKVQQGLQELTL